MEDVPQLGEALEQVDLRRGDAAVLDVLAVDLEVHRVLVELVEPPVVVERLLEVLYAAVAPACWG